ncbi:MAG TPA: hypothetical protein VEP49_11440, partial [Acidimicrobiia bacterium]|nr:hypothetical protein [Acidimicrobiia bacterium]
MHLFTRSRRMQPATVTEALQLTVQITEHVRSVTGTEVNAWGTVLSPALGTVVWSLWVERLADLIAAN